MTPKFKYGQLFVTLNTTEVSRLRRAADILGMLARLGHADARETAAKLTTLADDCSKRVILIETGEKEDA